MKKSEKCYLINFDTGNQKKKNPEILRILLSEQYTQIDFGYVAPWIYDRGGWIHIAAHTYIQVKGDKKKYTLKEAKNIPLAPYRLDFESTQDWRVFSLIFEPIPLKSCVINIIEQEYPSKNDFNFYSIKLKDATQKEVLLF
jgi:hypothetical protein